jgi:serine/threonine protein phosphatase PrpC
MGWFLAVMDGHGGSRAADACLEELPRAFEASLSFQQGEIVLRYTVEKLVRATKDMEEGSTLSLVWVREDRDEATIAVIGDSPVLNQRTPHE